VEVDRNSVNLGNSWGRGKWAIVFAVVVLSYLTVSANQFIERFGIEKQQLLENSDFSEGVAPWQIKGSENVTLGEGRLMIASNLGRNHQVFQTVQLDEPGWYQVSFWAEATKVVPNSSEKWALASVVIIHRDADGNRSARKTIAQLKGTVPEKYYSENIKLNESVSGIDFTARVLQASGTIVVREPVISILTELNKYKAARLMASVSWVILFIVLVYLAFTVLQIWQMLLFASLTIGVLLGTVEWPKFLQYIYGSGRSFEPGAAVSKFGHLIAFTGLGIFAGAFWRPGGFLFCFSVVIAFALATEALQTFVYGRTANMGDFIVDFIGCSLGFLLGVIVVECLNGLRRIDGRVSKVS